MTPEPPGDSALTRIIAEVVRRSDGEIKPETIFKWVGQFKPEELPILLRLLGSLRFYSSSKVQSMVTELHLRIQAAVSLPIDRQWFVPVGYVAKSGSAIAFFYKKQNDLPAQRFLMARDLTAAHFTEGSAVVFLDDFIGSGHQAVQFWWNVIAPILPRSHNCQFVLGSLVGYEEGIQHVEQSTKLKVIALDVLEDSDRAFSTTSRIFQNADERTAALSTIQEYGRKLYPKFPAGYADSQSLLGFFYSTPNNSLPVLWSTEGGWFPLLPRAEVLRDPADLLGPRTQESTPLVQVVSTEPDLDSIPEEISSCLVREFKTLGIVSEIAIIFSRLGAQSVTFPKVVQLIGRLKHLQHERVPVQSCLAIVPRNSPIGAELFAAADVGADIDSSEELLSLVQLVRGDSGAFVLSGDGRALGNWLYPRAQTNTHYSIPDAAKTVACASSYIHGVLMLFNGAGRASLFYDGTRLLVHRGSTWHRTGIDDRILASLAQRHNLRVPIIQSIFRLAFNLSDSGEGALITVGDHEEVLRYSDKPNTKHVRWTQMSIESTVLAALLPLFSQDGATIVSAKGIVIQGLTFLRPPAGVVAVEEVGKGSKHSTAAKISKITKALVVAVSVDGRITVFSNGEHALKRMG